MSKHSSQFVFMTCRAGAEIALKQEVARTEPDWRLSYSRPGFLTFKLDRPDGDQQLAERHWTFAHAHGLSLGKVMGDSLAQLVEQIWSHEGVKTLVAAGELADIHVWQREPTTSDDRGLESPSTPLAEEIERALRAAAPPECEKLRPRRATHRVPAPRQRMVLDIIVVEPNEWWIGCHRAVTQPERWPGGAIPVDLPPHAVSRAYAKLEEALVWSGLPLAAEEECVEIGCAPGGASQALLDRGLFVTGIDPANVEPVVLEHPRFRHLRKRGKEVPRKEFIGVRWLVADMNIAPQATLDEVESIVKRPNLAFRGLILTLKFANWTDSEQLPAFVAQVHDWGFRDVRVRQLVSGGQEVCLVALRRRALRRLSGKRHRGRRAGRSTKPALNLRRDDGHKSLPGPHF